MPPAHFCGKRNLGSTGHSPAWRASSSIPIQMRFSKFIFFARPRRQILFTDRWTTKKPTQPAGVIVLLQIDRNRVRLWIIKSAYFRSTLMSRSFEEENPSEWEYCLDSCDLTCGSYPRAAHRYTGALAL